MAELLTPQEIAESLAAIHDVTDTFFKSPIRYWKGGDSVDPYQEDRGNKVYTPFDLKGLIEYEDGDGDKEKEGPDGGWHYEAVTCSFNVEDLIPLGVVVTAPEVDHIVLAEADYMRVRGQVYKINDVYFDGPLQHQPVLLIIKGKLEQHPPQILP